MATRSKAPEVVDAVENPEVTSIIEVVGDSIVVRHSRSYTFQPIPFESVVISNEITRVVPENSDMEALGEDFQRRLDMIQGPELNRIADAVEHNPKKNKESFLYGILA